MPRLAFAVALSVLAVPVAAPAQSASLPGCEAPPEVRTTIKDQLHGPAFDRLPYAAQLERKQQVLSRLIERYPRVVEPYQLWIGAAREDHLLHPELLAGLQKRYRDRAAAHPDDDPMALYLAGSALAGTDTPYSVSTIEKAQTLAPASPGRRMHSLRFMPAASTLTTPSSPTSSPASGPPAPRPKTGRRAGCSSRSLSCKSKSPSLCAPRSRKRPTRHV